jgi:hypothetical protein
MILFNTVHKAYTELYSHSICLNELVHCLEAFGGIRALALHSFLSFSFFLSCLILSGVGLHTVGGGVLSFSFSLNRPGKDGGSAYARIHLFLSGEESMCIFVYLQMKRHC